MKLREELPAGEKTWKTPLILQEGAGLFYKVPGICHMYSLSKKTIPRHIYFGQHDYQLLVPDCSGGYTWPEAFSQQTECGLLWKDELS